MMDSLTCAPSLVLMSPHITATSYMLLGFNAEYRRVTVIQEEYDVEIDRVKVEAGEFRNDAAGGFE
jgi:hypothetical protein